MLEPRSAGATLASPSSVVSETLPEHGIRSLASGHPLLDLDPDLGRRLSPERHAAARADLRVQVHRRATGPWPITATAPASTFHLGLLVIEGVIASDVSLEDVVSTELLGPGDIVRPWPVDDPERMVGDESGWLVLAPCRLAVLDQRFALALARYPEVYAVFIERMDRRARRLGRTQAIAQLNRVERRVLAMLWHLAERWGRVTGDGVLIPLDISHRLLAQLVGARRPTVSTAVGELARAGRLERRADGSWLLHGEPIGVPRPGQEPLISRRRLLTDERSVAREHEPPVPDVAVDELEFRLRRLRREAAALEVDLDQRCKSMVQLRTADGESARDA